MNKQSVLVVEDHEPLLTAIKGVLESEGYAVLIAADGEQGLQVMEGATPDLIVADIMMPKMDGYTFYEQVRANPEWVHIPFIFLTAKAEREDILKGKALGAEDYLTKPFDPEELLVAVRSRLARAGAIREATTTEFEELKKQIVTVLSHELRTPLTYIIGYTDLALDDLSSLSAERLQEMLEKVKKGGDRLTRLVEDFLCLIQLDTGQAAEEAKRLTEVHSGLGEIVEEVVQQWQERAAFREVVLETEVQPDLPPVRLCKPFFTDSLGRLLGNAIKFSPEGGNKVRVTARQADGWVEVGVVDQGVGIPPEEIEHLFERFRQIGREELEQQGTGLGLAITRELIQLQGGDILVESALGEGSTFTIRLPVVET
jgi:signal transduction histidine kinase